MKRKKRFPALLVLLLLFNALMVIVLMVQARESIAPVDTSLFPAASRQASAVQPQTTEPETELSTEAATQPATEAPAQPAEQPASGTVIDTGVFKTVCPDGWLFIEQTDVFGEQDADGKYPTDPKAMGFTKGATSSLDVFSKLSTYIYYHDQPYSESTLESNKLWYTDTEDFQVSINGVECGAFHAKSADIFNEEAFYEYDIIFYPIDAAHYIQINLMTASPDTDDKVNVNDPDVQAMLKGLALD